jgi:NCAIR mutase (PurE)-related protein
MVDMNMRELLTKYKAGRYLLLARRQSCEPRLVVVNIANAFEAALRRR